MEHGNNIERIKKAVKSCIPWHVRYQIKLFEAKHPTIHIPMKSKQNVRHYNDALWAFVERFGGISSFQGKTVCELGPGQFLTHAALLYQIGVKRTYLLDIDDLVNSTKNLVKASDIIIDDKEKQVRKLPRPFDGEKWNTYIEKLNCNYAIDGIDGYKRIPDSTVDFCFSNAVLEHIRKNFFCETIEEMGRFMKTGGYACHVVDLCDHLGGGKNNLRIKSEIWEDDVHYKMDNYTNRLTCGEITDICSEAGFEILEVNRSMYDAQPLKRWQLYRDFVTMPDEELMTKSFVIKMIKTTNPCKN